MMKRLIPPSVRCCFLTLTISGLLNPAASLAADPSFTDISAVLGFTGADEDSSGVAWIDYNNDGWQDLYIPLGNGKPNRLYKNVDGANFELVVNSGTELVEKGMGATVADYDNDGWDDILVISNMKPVLLRNNGDGTFNLALESSIDTVTNKHASSFGDIDGDSDLDLVIVGAAGGLGNQVFRNMLVETGTSCVASATSDCFVPVDIGFLDITFDTLAVVMTDFDLDGDLDIYAIVDTATIVDTNTMYRNDTIVGSGIINFSPVDPSAGLSTVQLGMGVAVGDFNRDNKLDYYTTGQGLSLGPHTPITSEKLEHANVLLKNNGDNTFQNIAIDLGIWGDQDGFYWGSVFSDFDNDADQDLFVGAADGNALYRNNSGASFDNISIATGINLTFGRGIAVADFNRDGRVDIVSHWGTGYTSLLLNTTPDKKRWVQISLYGINSNRRGIGAKVRLISTTSTGIITQMNEINAGSSHSSSHQLMAHFGIPDGSINDTLQVEWPSGCVQTISAISEGPHEITETVNCQ